MPCGPPRAVEKLIDGSASLTFNAAFLVSFYWRSAVLLRTIALATVGLLYAALTASPGGATTLYVAANTTATTPCSATAPCGYIQDAMTAALPGDTIVCLSPPKGFPFSVTKSITIDCAGTRAQVRDSGVTGSGGGALVGIFINIAVSSSDPLRTVRLRGLTVDGAVNGYPRFLERGIEIQGATAVYLDDCVIENVIYQGIYDHRTGGQTKLFIKDTIISGNGGAGIVAASAAVGITVLDNVSSENNAYGIAVATGNNVAIRNSVFSGNSTAGIEGDGGSQVVVNNSTISHNNIGVRSFSSVRVSTNDIEFNNTAFSGNAGTMGSNRFSGNVSIGTAPTPISGAPADIGP
jgi:Periplasmic copper-binding protein (NosD)